MFYVLTQDKNLLALILHYFKFDPEPATLRSETAKDLYEATKLYGSGGGDDEDDQ